MNDYFINKDSGKMRAFDITDFVQGIVDCVNQGVPVDYESAHRVGLSFEVDLKEPPKPKQAKEPAVESQESKESQEPAQTQTEQPEQAEQTSEGTDTANPCEPSQGTPEGASQGDTDDLKAMTVQELDDFVADSSFAEVKDFANTFGITGRSKNDIADKLKEAIRE